jgi:Holliday junction resolvase
MQTPEGKVKADLKKILDGLGAYYFFPATGGYGRSGVPDVVGVVEGKFFAIECKAPGKKPTALQIREMKNIRKAGGIAFVYDGILSPEAVGIVLGVYRDA